MLSSDFDFSSKPSVSGPEGTRLESVEHLQHLLQPDEPARAGKKKLAPNDVVAYRPARRPSIALLCVLDDGANTGEWFRIRDDNCVIGRTDGNIKIPHDATMSSRHAEISRVLEQGYHRWMLTDLNSMNGTFVRIAGSVIHHQQQILLGGQLFRFDAAAQGAASVAQTPKAAADKPQRTVGWQAVKQADLIPSLVEITPQGEGSRIFLHPQDNWIGTDKTQCNITLENDPMLSPRHARLYRDEKGIWRVENAESLNGTWLRIQRVPLSTISQFQLGEQRFVFKIP